VKATAYPHIEIAADGTLMISGTPTRVLDVVLDRLAYHWDADEIQRQHPHLNLGQIYAALAYYHDHQADLDEEIDKRLREVDRLQAKHAGSPLAARLRELKAKR
jgi:uncharacterized protein (DUF433 family)